MTAADREPVPLPVRWEWTCPRCHTVLGRLSKGGNLHITKVGATVERSQLAVVVRCPCGQSKAFSGRRVLIDVPEAA